MAEWTDPANPVRIIGTSGRVYEFHGSNAERVVAVLDSGDTVTYIHDMTEDDAVFGPMQASERTVTARGLRHQRPVREVLLRGPGAPTVKLVHRAHRRDWRNSPRRETS